MICDAMDPRGDLTSAMFLNKYNFHLHYKYLYLNMNLRTIKEILEIR